MDVAQEAATSESPYSAAASTAWVSRARATSASYSAVVLEGGGIYVQGAGVNVNGAARTHATPAATSSSSIRCLISSEAAQNIETHDVGVMNGEIAAGSYGKGAKKRIASIISVGVMETIARRKRLVVTLNGKWVILYYGAEGLDGNRRGNDRSSRRTEVACASRGPKHEKQAIWWKDDNVVAASRSALRRYRAQTDILMRFDVDRVSNVLLEDGSGDSLFERTAAGSGDLIISSSDINNVGAAAKGGKQRDAKDGEDSKHINETELQGAWLGRNGHRFPRNLGSKNSAARSGERCALFFILAQEG